jgi:hypothetical protein
MMSMNANTVGPLCIWLKLSIRLKWQVLQEQGARSEGDVDEAAAR